MQVSEPGKTGPRLNEAGEMLTVFPPTSKEIGVLKSQGTKISKINICSLPTGGAEQLTSIHALTCPLGTKDWLKKVCDAGRVTNNARSSGVEDSFSAS